MRWVKGTWLALVAGTCAFGQTRDQIALHYAPVIYQEVDNQGVWQTPSCPFAPSGYSGDPSWDLLAAFDFDGDWNGDDQAENMKCFTNPAECNTTDNPSSPCANQGCPLIATTYYTVIETPTHWFVQYMPYHPLDWKSTNGHENDTESVLAVIAKESDAGSPFGTLEALETRFHDVWYQYAAPGVTIGTNGDNIDGPIHFDPGSGRPAVYQQRVGHGICGGFSPPDDCFPDLQLVCNHSQQPYIQNMGVVYSPDLPAVMPQLVPDASVDAGYALVELLTSVWPHIHEIGPGKAFQSAIDYQGERCGDGGLTCPTQFGGNWEGNEGQSPAEPWAQPGGNGANGPLATGDQFFDPAYTMSQRLVFPQPFSLQYCYNPYLGILDGCPGDAGADAGGEADGGIDSGLSDAGPPLPDAGARDAGASGSDAGLGGIRAHGCGCSSGGLGAWAAALLLALAAASRKRA